MHTNRVAGGWALIAVALTNLVVFMVHPVRPDTIPLIGPWGINAITHTLGVGIVPLFLFGCWALAEWLGLDRPIVRLALCANLVAAVLVAVAGLTSGWITPAAHEIGRDFANLGVAINRGMDRGYVGFMALAMAATGLALPNERTVLRLFSLTVGLGPLAWLFSGNFHPDVHAMLALAVGQLVWWIAIGRAMLAGEAQSTAAA